MPIKFLGVLAVALGSVSPAIAATTTLACRFVDGLSAISSFPEAEINQVVIETAPPSVRLRVAQSMGTKRPIEFVYANEDGEELSIIKDSLGVTVVGATRTPFVNAFLFEPRSGWFIWSQAWDEHNTRVWRYRCTS